MDDEYRVPENSALSVSPGVGWGLAGLLIGCTLLISACALMTFNVILYQTDLRRVPMDLARLGGVIGVGGVAILGGFAVWCGVRGWSASCRREETPALGIAGTVAGIVGFVAWAIAGIDMLAILKVIG